jgi:hypothetical protein
MPPNWVNLTRYPFGKRLNNVPIEALQTNFEMSPSFQLFVCPMSRSQFATPFQNELTKYIFSFFSHCTVIGSQIL